MRYTEPEVDRETAIKLWMEQRSDYAKEQMFLNNVGIIGIVMKSLKLNPHDEDLEQVGAEGLTIAINTYDQEKGYKFSAYATIVIRNELLNSFKKKRITPVVSLDDTFGDDEDGGAPLWDFISSGERFENLSVLKIDLENSLKRLPERYRKILSAYASGETQASIAREIGSSRENIGRILKNIQRKINMD